MLNLTARTADVAHERSVLSGVTSCRAAPLHRQRALLKWYAACVWLAAAAVPSVLQADPVSIPEFIARQAQFGDLVGSTFHLEGRVSTFSGNELRMKGTDVKFVFDKSLERPRSSNVQLVGRLERDGRDFRVIVQSLSDYPVEANVIRDRLRAGDVNDPETYFKLAQWTEDRGRFYADESLSAEARKLRTQGIQTAQRRTPQDRPTEFLELMEQATSWGLEDRLRRELLHAATRADLRVEAGRQVPAYAAVLNKIKSRFPGADQPAAEIPQPVQGQYTNKPEATYAAADDEQRKLLERLLYVETVLKMAAQEAHPDGGNGYAVAATIAKLAPEHAALAAEYRARELDFLESRVAGMQRAEVLEFRNRLREAGQPERALSVVRKWIDQQLIRRPKQPETDVDRAELEFEMTGDAERALQLAAAAMSTDPQVSGGAELLSLMGYGWHQGRAIRKELIPAAPPDPFAEAIRQGRILVEMSDQQVRAALGGAPQTIVRLARQGGATELWHYPDQRLTLQLESTTQKPELRVARILEQRPPAK